MENKILQGDSLTVLKTLESESVDCVITSPPYWGLRDYGVEGQLGLEKTPEEYVAKMVAVFSEVKRVLKKEGTVWCNLGDSYASTGREGGDIDRDIGIERGRGRLNNHSVIKPKDLVGIPWRVAFALQADGWYLRQDIIWHKPNPMPESVQDRCTKSHEYVFLLTKSPKYFFDNEAIKEPNANPERTNYTPGSRSNGVNPDRNDNDFALRERKKVRPHGVVRNRALAYNSKENEMRGTPKATAISEKELDEPTYGRNKRSVWTVNTMPYSEAHFATFPEKLIEPMVLAGCPKEVCNKCGKVRERVTEMGRIVSQGGSDTGKLAQNKDKINFKGGDISAHKFIQREHRTTGFTDCGCNAGFEAGIVLDIFMGAGTTAVVAKKLGRNFLGIELNKKYIEIAERRIAGTTSPLF